MKQLEKYIEPLRRMITKIGTEDQDRLAKMKKLLEILSNPEKRMPLATLQKCEDVLKKMNLPDIEPGIWLLTRRGSPVDRRPSTAEAPPIGKIHPFSKIAITLEPVLNAIWMPFKIWNLLKKM